MLKAIQGILITTLAIIILFIGGYSLVENNVNLSVDTYKSYKQYNFMDAEPNQNTIYIKMFYWDNNADLFLVKEIPVISLSEEQVLIDILKDDDFIGKDIIPYATIDIDSNNNLATVDIPSLKINGTTSPGDKIVADALRSLAYTLCVNSELKINKVQYLLDGQKIDTIGPICTDVPISLDDRWSDIYMK